MRSRWAVLALNLVLFIPGCGLVGTAVRNIAAEARDTHDTRKENPRKATSPVCPAEFTETPAEGPNSSTN